MKLRYIFTALAAAALAFVGCQEEERFLDEVKVSESIVAIPITGGEAKLTINATADWSFVETKLWPEEVTKDKDGNETRKPSWVTVDVTSGGAGETEVTISAEEASANRELNLYVACAGVQQTVKVVQMAERVPAALATCKQVLDDHAAGVAVGKTYKVKGTVTDITNYDKYGCFYVNDGTGQVYVYGSMNSDQFDPSVGDIITFEGPWTSYGNFDDVTILELEKSLLKVEKVTPEAPVGLEGGKVTVTLTIKAKEFEVVIPEDAQEWLTYDEEKDVMVLGETTYIFDFTLAPNEAGARKTTVTFVANVDGVDYSAAFEVEQLGAIVALSVADFLAAPEGTALYELTGIVKNLANTTYGNFDLVDATGSVYVYGLTNNGAIGSNDKKFAEIGINEGDVITIIGTRTSHKENPQVGGTAYLKEHVVAAKAATVAEFLAQPKGTWCKMTATLSNLKSDVYGNFDLVDETGSVYVYGLTSSFVAKNDKSFASLGLKEGDIVTLVGKRDSHNDQDQVGGPAYYVSHVAGSTEPEEPETPEEPEEPETPETPEDPVTPPTDEDKYEPGVTWTLGTKAYDVTSEGSGYDNSQRGTVNDVTVSNILKLGSGSAVGDATINVPAGTKKLGFYCVAWKDKNSTEVKFSVDGTEIAKINPKANVGATGNPPYTLTLTEDDYYTVNVPDGATSIKVETTSSSQGRAMFIGLKALTE